MCRKPSVRQEAPTVVNEASTAPEKVVQTYAPAVAAPSATDGGLSQETAGTNESAIKRKGKRSLRIPTSGGGNSTGLNI